MDFEIMEAGQKPTSNYQKNEHFRSWRCSFSYVMVYNEIWAL